ECLAVGVGGGREGLSPAVAAAGAAPGPTTAGSSAPAVVAAVPRLVEQRVAQHVAAVGVLIDVVRDVVQGVPDLARGVVAGQATVLTLLEDLRACAVGERRGRAHEDGQQ